jgi:hypothetical protein
MIIGTPNSQRLPVNAPTSASPASTSVITPSPLVPLTLIVPNGVMTLAHGSRLPRPTAPTATRLNVRVVVVVVAIAGQPSGGHGDVEADLGDEVVGEGDEAERAAEGRLFEVDDVCGGRARLHLR